MSVFCEDASGRVKPEMSVVQQQDKDASSYQEGSKKSCIILSRLYQNPQKLPITQNSVAESGEFCAHDWYSAGVKPVAALKLRWKAGRLPNPVFSMISLTERP